MLMNSEFILDQALRFARRLQQEAGPEPAAQVTRAWRLAFNRPPTDSEMTDALDFLAGQETYLETSAQGKDEKSKPKTSPELQALTNLCQALLGANEFLYID
jgi:hypothetical protein